MRGLTVGAPVDFRGVTIGEVVRIGVSIDPKTFGFHMLVEVKIFPRRLTAQQFIGIGWRSPRPLRNEGSG